MIYADFTRRIIEYEDKSDEELLQFLSDFWGIKPNADGVFTLVAKYQKSEKRDKNGNEFAMFVDVRNSIGDILYYPFHIGTVAVWTKCDSRFEKQEYWQINVKLADKKYREENPFALTMANKIVELPSMEYKDRLEKEKFIKKIFKETGATERDAKNTSNALRAIMGDLYTETERFVFELLQNADDQPQENSMVEVKLKTLNENLLFLHSGKAFSEKDVESISSIGDSTKKNDTEKTGYKGIGFKSVFSDAETVFINSGNFSFAFDKHSPVYPKNANMEEIPWQIKPIWEEKYRLPRELQNEPSFFTSSVSIALHVGAKNITNYDRIIPKLLSEPRFVLFLRNIGKIIFDDNDGHIVEIQKTIDDNIIRVHSNGITENWVVKDYIIPIPQETRDEMQNEKLIPAKLKEATRTKIIFAARVDGTKIIPVANSVLFTYLPTKVSDFGFPFLVNADFLTTASRESIHFKNIWNRFIFKQIGYLLLEWVESLQKYEGALCVLPTKELGKGNILWEDFMDVYKGTLDKKVFIKGHKGDVLPQDKIILDRTGLSRIIGKDLFCVINNTEKQLPYYEIDASILENGLFEGVERINSAELRNRLVAHKGIFSWYINANEVDKTEFNKWLIDNKCVNAIKTLPLFRYPDGWKSVNGIEHDANYIVLSEKLSCLEGVLDKLGFKYPDSFIENNPFADYVQKTNEEHLFDEVVKRARVTKLSPEEKLLIVTTKFEGVGEKKITQVRLFCNEWGIAKPLANMVQYRDDAPVWLKPYMISQEENFENITKLLIQDREIYSKVIENKFEEILGKASLKDLYLVYKDSWTQSFSKKIIDFYGEKTSETRDYLSFIELQSLDVKSYYLYKIKKIPIDVNRKYSKYDFVCRVLRLAFDVYPENQMRSFVSKLYVGERSLVSFTVSDEVTLEYCKGKKLDMPLSWLLPDFNDSNMILKIRRCLSVFNSSELNRLLSLVPMSTGAIWQEINKSTLTPAQYLLGIYQTRKIHGYYAGYVPNIDLSKVDDKWIKTFLDILYAQKVELFDDSFGYRLSPYFKGYFGNGYVNVEEKILPAIEKWANNDDKRDYLVSLGVKTERSKLIQLRKSIINNESVNAIDVESQKENIDSTIKLFVSKKMLPFTKENQISAMRIFERYNRNIISQFDLDILKSSSSEYVLPEYLSWKTDGKISICLYKKEMPKKLIYKSNLFACKLLICRYDEGDYYYEPSNRTLYINGKNEVRDILYSLILDEEVPFDVNDWQKLYYDNLVSKSEVESRDKEIQKLKEKLKRYEQRFGSLGKDMEDNNDKNYTTNDEEKMECELKKEVEVKDHGKDIDRDEMDEDIRKGINHDARIAAKEYLESLSGYDCSEWNPEDGSHLVLGLIKYKGEPINIAITSSKSRKLYLHPWVFAGIMDNPNNLLLNYGADERIHALSFNDVFKNNPNVNLIFDTDVVSPEHIAELANRYMTSKRTCFVIENPKYSSSNVIQSFGLKEKKKDGWVNIDFSDEDIFNW